MPDEIKILAFSDYPVTLQNMKAPPKQLYMRGVMPDRPDQRYLCVIGSRNWTSYGRDSVTKIINGLQGYPISIVSGLAIGIDSIAHMAALEAGLHCVAFPGSSLEWEKIYPPSHRGLAGRIIDGGGALLSRWDGDYPMGRWAFPSRNVLMAGISHATLVVEAGKRSGSLMTAKHAEDFGRDVLAVPGSINTDQSYGPHMLIRKGAGLVSTPEDVLEELGFEVSRKRKAILPERVRSDKESSAILKILALEEASLDELMEKTGIATSKLNEKLSFLELEGLVKIDGAIVKKA